MKKIWILVLIAFIIISALTLTGCDPADNEIGFFQRLLGLLYVAS